MTPLSWPFYKWPVLQTSSPLAAAQTVWSWPDFLSSCRRCIHCHPINAARISERVCIWNSQRFHRQKRRCQVSWQRTTLEKMIPRTEIKDVNHLRVTKTCMWDSVHISVYICCFLEFREAGQRLKKQTLRFSLDPFACLPGCDFSLTYVFYTKYRSYVFENATALLSDLLANPN